MWISDNVKLDDELLTAQQNGKLVIFAGAGVSIAPPSNFPDFANLANKVNNIAGKPLHFDREEPIDRFLGKLKKQDINVHRIVQRELMDPESRPTELHSSILSIFKDPKEIKIVTTNFDIHFSTAASHMSLNIPIYKAPALPLGRDFNGIIYLHGSVEQAPQKLILTDEDFGQAYLTDGWATRFLADLFSSYTVLFIGYSHGDPIMQYLGRGLPLTSPRYALDKQGSDSNWNLFNIVPINFPLKDIGNKYQELTDAVNSWGSLIQMDYVDHAARIKGITGQDPKNLNKHEEDYILYCLKDFRLTRIFVHYVKDFKWLEWLEEKRVVDPLFSYYAQTTDIDSILAWWIAQNFVCNKSEDCLSMIQRKGQQIHAVLWSNIIIHLNYRERPESPTFARWASVLLNSIPQQPDVADALTHLLTRCKHPEDASLIMLLLEFLMKPYMHLDKYINFHGKETEQKVELEIKLAGSDFELNEAYKNIILPNLPYYADYLESMVTTNLRNAHHILRAAGNANVDWDHKSYVRKAIAEHLQNGYRGDFDILINIAKSVIEHYAQNSTIRIRDILETWFASDVPLLKRLAIHGLTETTSISAEDKILWVLEKDIIFSWSMKPETYRLLKICYPIAQKNIRKAVITAVTNYIQSSKVKNHEENKGINYNAYNLLSWLLESVECELAIKELSKLQKKYPQFAPREHPDLLSWGKAGFIPLRSPLSAEKLIISDFSTILSTIINCDNNIFVSTERHGLFIEIQTATNQNFDWSLMLFKSLAQSDNVPLDIWLYIFQGWSNQDIPEKKWRELLNILLVNQHLHGLLGDQFSDLLNYKFSLQYKELPKSLRKLALKLSKSIWISASTEQPTEISNWFDLSSSRPEGKIVEFWMKCLDEEIKIQGTRKLFLQFKTMFNQVLTKKSFTGSLGRISLVSELGFLASLDLDWTIKNLISLFDWSNEAQALQVWQGYLVGIPHESVLKYLNPLYEQAFDKLELLDDSSSERFVHHIAVVCVYSKTTNPLEGGWLTHFLRKCNQVNRILWADQILREITKLDPDEKLRIWDKWIKQFLELRVDGIPKIDSDMELASFYQWAPNLGLAFPHIVEILTTFAPPKFKNIRIFYYIIENKLHQKFPDATINLIAHVLNSHTYSMYSKDLLIIYSELKELDISADKIRKLLNSLIQFGCLEII